jgi:hypothetical protein
MGLDLYYREDDQFVKITSDSDLTNPLEIIHNGRTGDTVTTQLYLRNDDATKWFSNVLITPTDLVGADPYGDVIFTETGWGVKLSAGASEPTANEWEDIDWGNTITMSNVGTNSVPDTTTYSPLWHLETCPPNIEAQVKTDLVVTVSYTENAVT